MQIYIQLLHGRKDPAQEMDDWGEDGPCLGPFNWFHATYLSDFNLGTKENGIEWVIADSKFSDLIHYDGTYYGDFEIVPEGQTQSETEPFDPDKAKLPPALVAKLAAMRDLRPHVHRQDSSSRTLVFKNIPDNRGNPFNMEVELNYNAQANSVSATKLDGCVIPILINRFNG